MLVDFLKRVWLLLLFLSFSYISYSGENFEANKVKKRRSVLGKVIDTSVEVGEKVYDAGKSLVSDSDKKEDKTEKRKKANPSVDSNKTKKDKTTLDKVIDTTVELGEKAYETGKSAVKSTNKKLGSSRLNREKKTSTLLFNYSFFDTWIPSKYGLAYTYISSPEGSWEFDWNHSSISFDLFITDLGKMTEDRIGITRRVYSQRNSFYWSYGINYYRFQAYLGEKFLSNIPNTPNFAIDLLEISSLGIHSGIGNRWQFKNWVIGFDWFSIYVPVVILESKSQYFDYATNENDRKNVKDALDVIKHFPTFTALKFQVGYSW